MLYRQVFDVTFEKGHYARVGNDFAIIGESHRAGLRHRGDLGNLFALAPLGRAADDEHPRLLRQCGLVMNELDPRRRIQRRRGVGHDAHGGESAVDRARRAAGDGLAMHWAWLAEVNVNIHQPRRNDAAFRINHVRSRLPARRG